MYMRIIAICLPPIFSPSRKPLPPNANVSLSPHWGCACHFLLLPFPCACLLQEVVRAISRTGQPLCNFYHFDSLSLYGIACRVPA